MSNSRLFGSGAPGVTCVWAANFAMEMSRFLMLIDALGDASIAFDVEFPGFFSTPTRGASQDHQYAAMAMNTALLEPIQIGLAVANSVGEVVGVWEFNLEFDVNTHLHCSHSVGLLSEAGLKLNEHRVAGIRRADLQRRFVESFIPWLAKTGPHCQFVSFAGLYDYAYLLKLLVGPSLPPTISDFFAAVDDMFPCRCELRSVLPYGSLDALAAEFNVERRGAAHSAASDSLLTLELYQAAVVVDGCHVVPARSCYVDRLQVPSTMFRHPPGLQTNLPSLPFGRVRSGESMSAGIAPCRASSWACHARSVAQEEVARAKSPAVWLAVARATCVF